ncbi:Phosphotransferase enzyme family protein [Parafrankia irregularis]|uniref:Phosphotransferase enzyme family protein n=1 Tax=Parafrankia irregularis TaxID=795642 RepID=A0A0S4QJ58_9ACTN|nr:MULTISPECIES: phosphotransferase [Parafrankia]MBE3204017.1 phosphotransferase [Parafrankia sp. CH37]CUU55106.1 Phosphotransferase enzyme family protein [Parafrankia irregularis]
MPTSHEPSHEPDHEPDHDEPNHGWNAGDRVPVVDDPAAVTPQWLTAALRAGGTEAEIIAVSHEAIGTGQLGASYRFHLQARPGQDGSAPSTVVIKMAAGDLRTRSLIATAYRQETGFYRVFAPSARIRVPRCWYAGLADDGLSFTLVLEDAHPASPGRQVQGCTTDQATAAVRNLAGLHAPFWNDDTLTEQATWLRRTSETALRSMREVLVSAADTFVARFRADLSVADADVLLRTADQIARWGRRIRHRTSLIHGDYRLDNLLFTADGQVVTVDWQTLEAGFPGRDLAYFLSTALPAPQRRRQETSLVAAYHERLLRHGVTDYPLDACFEDYRLGTLHGPMTAMIGCVYAPGTPTESSDQMFLSMATNCAAAIRELGTLDLL